MTLFSKNVGLICLLCIDFITLSHYNNYSKNKSKQYFTYPSAQNSLWGESLVIDLYSNQHTTNPLKIGEVLGVVNNTSPWMHSSNAWLKPSDHSRFIYLNFNTTAIIQHWSLHISRESNAHSDVKRHQFQSKSLGKPSHAIFGCSINRDPILRVLHKTYNGESIATRT